MREMWFTVLTVIIRETLKYHYKGSKQIEKVVTGFMSHMALRAMLISSIMLYIHYVA